MRTLRLSLAGTVMLVLLGGLGGAVLTQSDVDMPVTATYVTGKAIGYSPIQMGTFERGAGIEMMTDDQYELQIAWSDPRLPTVKHGRENAVIYHEGDDQWSEALAGSIRLEGPDGVWVGTAHGMSDFHPEQGRQMTKVMILEGQGAYEGLNAVLVATIDEAVAPMPSYEGFIFEGEAPSLPDPVEPFPAD